MFFKPLIDFDLHMEKVEENSQIQDEDGGLIEIYSMTCKEEVPVSIGDESTNSKEEMINKECKTFEKDKVSKKPKKVRKRETKL